MDWTVATLVVQSADEMLPDGPPVELHPTASLPVSRPVPCKDVAGTHPDQLAGTCPACWRLRRGVGAYTWFADIPAGAPNFGGSRE